MSENEGATAGPLETEAAAPEMSADQLQMAPVTPCSVYGSLATDVDLEVAQQKRCCTCLRKIDEYNAVVVCRAVTKAPAATWRCKACHALKAAVARLQKKHGRLCYAFSEATSRSERGASFFLKHAETRGKDLLDAMKETIEEYKSESTVVQSEGTGEYYDEQDIRKLYEGKGDQADNIIANTRRYYCGVRKTWLFEDVKYKRTATDRVEQGCRKSRRIELQDTAQAEPGDDEGLASHRKKQGKGEEKPAENQLPKLKAPQCKKLRKKLEGLNQKRVQALDLLDQAKALSGMVPDYVVDACTETVAKALKHKDQQEAMMTKGFGILETMQATTDEVTSLVTEAATRLAAATAFKQAAAS